MPHAGDDTPPLKRLLRNARACGLADARQLEGKRRKVKGKIISQL
jgi:hypothetical protein